MKYYFSNNDEFQEFCYTLPYFVEKMKELGVSRMVLFEAIPEYNSDAFFCTQFQEVGLKSDSDCGRLCEKYAPRNKTNGRCRFSSHTYIPGNECILVLCRDMTRHFLKKGENVVAVKR